MGKNFIRSEKDLWILTAIIFITLVANKLALPISGNEEDYLGFAMQFFNPGWIRNSFTLSDFPGSRLFFQLIVGWPLQFLPWETALCLFRFINFFLLAVGLAFLFRKLKLHYLEAFFIFQIYIITAQSFFGGEWIFYGFEPKTLAYIFVFPSLAYFPVLCAH